MSVDGANPNRRKFLANVAGRTAAIAAAGLTAGELLAERSPVQAPRGAWDMSWVDRVQRAKHRQVFDAPGMAEGMALNNAVIWLNGYSEVYETTDADMAAVLVFRHKGLPVVLNDDMWSRLKLGDDDKLKDPTTGEPTTRNPFINAKAGDRHLAILAEGALDSLIARGVTVLCCNLALMRTAGTLAKAEGISRESAQQAMIDSVLPGVTRMPSGVFATSRAEEAGARSCGRRELKTEDRGPKTEDRRPRTEDRGPMKSYDRAYFDRWYRDPRVRVATAVAVARKAHLVISIAEALLLRQVRSVLDIGCGEGTWRAPLMKLRPSIRYAGVDSSEYVIARFGKRRGIRRGVFGALAEIERSLRGPFDVIVCCDMLQYVPAVELRAGLRSVASLLGGVAYLEAYTSGDAVEGDRRGWHSRSADEYRRAFVGAGLFSVGMHCWVGGALAGSTAQLERAE